MMEPTIFNISNENTDAAAEQVPDDFEEFDWVQISETPD